LDVPVESRPSAPRAVDLRRSPPPTVEIVSRATYDLLISLHVTLEHSDLTGDEFDVGKAWIEAARARCNALDPNALLTLGHYLDDGRPTSLRGTLISLVARCPEPRDRLSFLSWLETVSPAEIAEVLLDQEGLPADWSTLLHTILGSGVPADLGHDNQVQRLVNMYPAEVQATVMEVLNDPVRAQQELVAALRIWDDAVFKDEAPRILPLLEHDAEALRKRRAEMSHDRFIEYAMRGVEWQRPAGLRRIVFAPSYFGRPAVFYHFWQGTLTFCYPCDVREPVTEASVPEPRPPAEDVLRFFEVLGDPTRLRILRLLSGREMYLTELADRLGLTKATTKHHMIRLRAAGCVTLYDRDRMTFYALKPDQPQRAARLLEDYLAKRD